MTAAYLNCTRWPVAIAAGTDSLAKGVFLLRVDELTATTARCCQFPSHDQCAPKDTHLLRTHIVA